MENIDLEKLRYPIGKFTPPSDYTNAYFSESIATIVSFPERLRKAVSSLSQQQLDTPYRPGGWTVRQVIHHCADSHMNCLIRFKWALTEENPTIKYYFEDRWSELDDNRNMPIEPTLALLDGLHYRLAFMMEHLSDSERQRTFVHPEHNKQFMLKEIIGLYAWHSSHHLAHITALIQRNGW